jgi:hypothetical protein
MSVIAATHSTTVEVLLPTASPDALLLALGTARKSAVATSVFQCMSTSTATVSSNPPHQLRAPRLRIMAGPHPQVALRRTLQICQLDGPTTGAMSIMPMAVSCKFSSRTRIHLQSNPVSTRARPTVILSLALNTVSKSMSQRSTRTTWTSCGGLY